MFFRKEIARKLPISYHAVVKEQLAIGNLKLGSPVLLAPMCGYTDLPFRLAVRRLGGVGLACTEMINPRSVLFGGGRKRNAILATAPEDRPLGHQVYGTDPALMAEAAQWLTEKGAQLIDINMGCPKRKICSRGAGAGMLKNPDTAVKLAKRVADAVPVPVTVKLRLGWDQEDVTTAARLAPELEQAGIAAVTVHGRTCAQGFSGKSDWKAIRQVVEHVHHIPVIANGDIISPETALAVLVQTGCAGVMIGRAALKFPWIIRDIECVLAGRPRVISPTVPERLDFMLRHFEAISVPYGERVAVVLFRRWIPQYAKSLRMDRPTMIKLLKIRDAGLLRTSI
ncbi:tRNA dihydrouridine synthase DusB, partial [Verrucomicrobiota bacterium]